MLKLLSKFDAYPVFGIEKVSVVIKKSFKENPSFTKLQFLQINPSRNCPDRLSSAVFDYCITLLSPPTHFHTLSFSEIVAC